MDGIELGTQFEFSYAPGTSQQQILGFEMAGQIWSQYLKDDVTIQIHVETTDQLPENVIGGALPGMKTDLTYQQLWHEMLYDMTSIDDLSAASHLTDYDQAYRALVDGKEISGVGKMRLTNANAKALNLLDGDRRELDGYILISDLSGQSNVQWDYDLVRNNNVDANSLDFLSVALHEVGHVLGFVSGMDDGGWLNVVTEARNQNQAITDDAMAFSTPLDLFRYSADSAANSKVDLSVGQEAFFSIDGGKTHLGYFSTGESTDLGGDGYQASHWKNLKNKPMGIMDPVLKIGQTNNISTLDVKAMDVMGWDVANGIDWGKFFSKALKADWELALSMINNATIDNFGEFDWKKLYDLVIENADPKFIAKLSKNWDKAKLGQFDWNELYQRAIVEADRAFVGDRTGDVQRMIDQSETYYGRRSRSSDGSWQVGLWQHIKFQTLDTSSVDTTSSVNTETSYEVYVNSALVTDSFVNIETDIPVIESKDDVSFNNTENKIEYKSLEDVDLTENLTKLEPAESKVNTIKESKSFNLLKSGQLTDRIVEIVDSLNEDLIMPIS